MDPAPGLDNIFLPPHETRQPLLVYAFLLHLSMAEPGSLIAGQAVHRVRIWTRSYGHFPTSNKRRRSSDARCLARGVQRQTDSFQRHIAQNSLVVTRGRAESCTSRPCSSSALTCANPHQCQVQAAKCSIHLPLCIPCALCICLCDSR